MSARSALFLTLLTLACARRVPEPAVGDTSSTTEAPRGDAEPVDAGAVDGGVTGGALQGDSLPPERAAGPGCDPLPVVYFELDSSDLDVGASEAVARIATCVRERGARAATIEAFADERGPADYNVGLSQRRGDEVRATLARMGVTAKLRVLAWGEAFPASPGGGEEHWRLNRRAVVKFPGESLADARQVAGE